MDFQMVIDLISNLGFPIVVVGCLMWFILYLMKTHKEELTQIQEAHKAETTAMQEKMDKTTDALNANTTVIAELRTLIEQYMKQQDIVGVVGVYDLLLRRIVCAFIPLIIPFTCLMDWLWVGWKASHK